VTINLPYVVRHVAFRPAVTEENQMSLIRWDPFSEIDRIDRTFNRMLSGTFFRTPRFAGEGAKLEWSPSADISENDKEYLIRAELPAVKKDDVKVTVDGGMITIEGERKQEKEDKTEKYHRVERVYGNFTRSFSLPENVNVEGIRCEDKDGVLTVHIPKTQTEKVKPKQIKVD
jgi:HSP20 family protein